MNKKAQFLMDILPLLIIFIVGTIMIAALGYFLINYMSTASNATGYSIFGTSCYQDNCKRINAGVMALVILALVIFQYFFYKKYRNKTGR